MSTLALQEARYAVSPAREMGRRMDRLIGDARATMKKARIATYGRGWFMTFFLTYFQHKMVHQDGPKAGQFIPPPPVHYSIAQAVEEALSGLRLKLMQVIEVFRGAAKTTLVIEAGALAGVIKGRRNIVLLCIDKDTAKSRIQSLSYELTNNTQLLIDYPELARAKDDKGQWVSYTDYQIVFANGARIKAYPFMAKLRGLLWLNARPDLWLIDDVEDDTTQANEKWMRDAKRFLRKVLVAATSAFGALLWLGTPVGPNCLLYWCREPAPEGMGLVPAVIQPFYDNVPPGNMEPHPTGATPHWAAAWHQERIEHEFELMGYSAWMQEMNLIPLPEDDATFLATDFDNHSYDPRLLHGLNTRRLEYNGQSLSVWSWWDSAISKKDKAARTAIVTVGILPYDGVKQRMLVLEARFGRWDDMQQKEHLREVNQIWHPNEIGAQATLLEKAIGPAARRQYGVPFQEYQQSNAEDAKHARIKSLVPMAREGQILFNHTSESQTGKGGLRTELVNYGYYPTKDILDALEGAVKLALTKGGQSIDPDKAVQTITTPAAQRGKW